ncbi:MAG: hypothetical protein MSA56_05645 [Clostridium sp.]|nr:hypothetical protein [Clostridium sp.]
MKIELKEEFKRKLLEAIEKAKKKETNNDDGGKKKRTKSSKSDKPE